MSIRKRTWRTAKGERSAWAVDYMAYDPKRKKVVRRLKTCPTKKAAVAWATDALHEVRHGTHTADSASVTVKEAAENWIKRAELEGRERSTIKQYRGHVTNHIVPLVGGVKLSRLTTPDVEAVRDRLLEKLSRTMAKKVLVSIKGILREAQRRGKVSQNVASGVRIVIGKRHRRRLQVGVDVPSKDEVRRILEAAGKHAKGRWRPLIVVAALAGLRASEIRGLRWDDVDLKAGVIHVRVRADAWNSLGSPKSEAGERTVTMSPTVLSTLKEWRLACPKGELGLVFPNGIGRVEELGNIHRRGYGPVQVAAGVVTVDDRRKKPKYNLHALRHFYASWLIDEGFPVKRVQTLLGHSSIVTTMDTYSHWLRDEDDDRARLATADRVIVG